MIARREASLRIACSKPWGPSGAHVVSIVVWAAALAIVSGCGGGKPARSRPPSRPVEGRADGGVATPGPSPQATPMSQEVRDRLLEGAIDVLGNLETYDESVAFAQVFDRLNQWSHAVVASAGATAAGDGERGDGGWTPDPYLAALPERLRPEALVRGLDGMSFDATADVLALRDQRWLADVAATARGDAIDDLDVAGALFEWTVRSLAIASDPPMVPSEANPGARWFSTGEILLAGRASAAQRAWVFLELVRHAGLDGVMLATGDANGGAPRPWIPAVLSGGEAYLFDPGYGMPIPGPGGEGVATARQAAADPAILAAMSLPDRPYPVQAGDVARLSVLVAATPWSLSKRMHHLDRQLAGARKVDLSIDAAAVARRALAALPDAVGGDGDATTRAGLWEFPWESIVRRRAQRPAVEAAIGKELGVMTLAIQQTSGNRETRAFRPLYAARLREFRGQFDGPDGAKVAYLAARPGNSVIADVIRGVPEQQAQQMKRVYDELKGDATYWLGVLTLAEKEYETAVDYLDRMTLQANPDGIWSDAARVNLARARIGLGQPAEAAALLREDASPQRYGSRILAERLSPAAPVSPP